MWYTQTMASMTDLDGVQGKCWPWPGMLRKGYARVSVNGQLKTMHRVLYELAVEEIPEGLELDHLCHNTACINPEHLEPVTTQENLARRYRLVTACMHGHAYTDLNTAYRADGTRICRQCRRDRSNRWWAKQKESK